MRNPPGAGYAAGQEAMEMSATQSDKAEAFRALHREGCFVMPNPWDAGSARLLAGMGFAALATSSGAAAAVLGRRDGELTRDEALAHARGIVAASELPVAADLENGFGGAPEAAALTIRLAAEAGRVGGAIEDAGGLHDRSIYGFTQAELREAGVRRISLATSLYRAAMEGLCQAADEARRDGRFGLLDRCP